MLRHLVWVILFLCLTSGFAHSAAGDRLFIHKSGVNVRSGPGTKNAVLMQLNAGHPLSEISRRDSWVQVDIAWIGGEGWVHESLLGPNPPEGFAAPPDNADYWAFVQDIETLNQDILDILGDVFFKRIEMPEPGEVRLTATEIWLQAPPEQKRQDLEALHELWSAHLGHAAPISLSIVDARGKVVMEKSPDSSRSQESLPK